MCVGDGGRQLVITGSIRGGDLDCGPWPGAGERGRPGRGCAATRPSGAMVGGLIRDNS